MPQLIVNGDDLGFSPGVNQGILTAHQEGIVTSTTVMINLDYAAEGLALAQKEAPNLGIGLHINLTYGRPVSSHVRTLVDENGYFYPETRLLDVALGFDEDELYEEIAAQIERFVALTGHPPTHLDSHYHVAFLHPLALKATLTLAEEYGGLPLRESNFTQSDEDLTANIQRFLPDLPADPLKALLPALKAVYAEMPPANMPTRFDTRFSGPNITLGDLLVCLMDLPEDRPTELLCHPGIMNDPLNTMAANRQRELDALTHPATREVIDRYHIELVNYTAFQRGSHD